MGRVKGLGVGVVEEGMVGVGGMGGGEGRIGGMGKGVVVEAAGV